MLCCYCLVFLLLFKWNVQKNIMVSDFFFFFLSLCIIVWFNSLLVLKLYSIHLTCIVSPNSILIWTLGTTIWLSGGGRRILKMNILFKELQNIYSSSKMAKYRKQLCTKVNIFFAHRSSRKKWACSNRWKWISNLQTFLAAIIIWNGHPLTHFW